MPLNKWAFIFFLITVSLEKAGKSRKKREMWFIKVEVSAYVLLIRIVSYGLF